MKTNEEKNQTLPEFNVTAWDRSRQRLQTGAVLLAALAFAAGAPVWAQDVAEAARQAQARRHQQAKHKKHVYTEEDLKRASILTREDRELLDAKKRDAALPGAEVPAALDAQALEHLPLSDVARMYRAMKELNHSQTGEFAEYHLPTSNSVLASPKLEFVVGRPKSLELPARKVPTPPVFSNTDLLAPKLNSLLVEPKPAAPTAAIKRSTGVPTVSTPPTIPAKSRFASSRPHIFVPATQEAPIAPVFANTEPISMAQLGLAASAGAIVPISHPLPTAPAFSNAASPRSIIVKYGDSLWKLAQINLGDGHRWHELAAMNPGIVNPQHIVPGTPISIAATEPTAPTSPNPSDSAVTVRKGDTLWRLAQKKLGFGGFWGCIAKANPVIHDANRIYTGQVLSVPESCDHSSK